MVPCCLNVNQETGGQFFRSKVTKLRHPVDVKLQSFKLGFKFCNWEGFRDSFYDNLPGSFSMGLNCIKFYFVLRKVILHESILSNIGCINLN